MLVEPLEITVHTVTQSTVFFSLSQITRVAVGRVITRGSMGITHSWRVAGQVVRSNLARFTAWLVRVITGTCKGWWFAPFT